MKFIHRIVKYCNPNEFTNGIREKIKYCEMQFEFSRQLILRNSERAL